MLIRWTKDKFYLLKYELLGGAILICLLALMLVLNLHQTPAPFVWLVMLLPILLNPLLGILAATAGMVFLLTKFYPELFNAYHLFLIPVGICFGISHVQLVHAAIHKSYQPRWLNRLIGEILSVQLFGSFLGFSLIHLQHHRHSADALRDPHPNRTGTFWGYVKDLDESISSHFEEMYFGRWGRSRKTEKIWKAYVAFVPLRQLLRASVILMVFGPVGFCFFFMPNLIVNQFVFAHMNYYTHPKKADGTSEIVNLDHNWKYKVMNVFLFGAYYHGNHHKAPWLFNPSKYDPQASRQRAVGSTRKARSSKPPKLSRYKRL